MPAKRFHWSGKPKYDARCKDCSWRTDAGNAQGAAALHHDRTGHTVETERKQVTTYETPQRYERRTGQKPPQASQGNLL